MEGYDKETYGFAWAGAYDELFPGVSSEMVQFLVDLVEGGRALELAIGTGRVAIPLVARGVDLVGIDISAEMVSRLRVKPGGEQIPVVIGDFADVPIEGSFGLVFLVFNTLFALLDQDEQIRCFHNVAAHLDPGGRFVLEAFFPDLGRFDRGQRIGVVDVELDSVRIEVSTHDPVAQRVDSHHVHLANEGARFYPVSVRYAWPSEIDLMARLAGLELEDRFGGWDRRPFNGESRAHVSVYRKP